MWFPQPLPIPSDSPAPSTDSRNQPASAWINPSGLQRIPAGVVPPASAVPIQPGGAQAQQYVHGGYIVDPSAAAMIQMMVFRQQQYAAAAAAAAANPNAAKTVPIAAHYPVNPYYPQAATPMMISPYFAAPTFVQQPMPIPVAAAAQGMPVKPEPPATQNKSLEPPNNIKSSSPTGRSRGRPRKRARAEDEDEYVDPTLPVRPFPRYPAENPSPRRQSSECASSADAVAKNGAQEGENGESEQTGTSRYGLRTSARMRTKVVDDASEEVEESYEVKSEDEQSDGSAGENDNSGSDGGPSRLEKRLKCPYCERTFSQSCSLKDHMNIHNNVRPYTCSDCGRAFSNSSNLNRHRRIHTGARPYHCDICMKSFSQSSNLKVHRRIHENKAAFVAAALGASQPAAAFKHEDAIENEQPKPVFNSASIADFEFIGDTAARPQFAAKPPQSQPPAAAEGDKPTTASPQEGKQNGIVIGTKEPELVAASASE